MSLIKSITINLTVMTVITHVGYYNWEGKKHALFGFLRPKVTVSAINKHSSVFFFIAHIRFNESERRITHSFCPFFLSQHLSSTYYVLGGGKLSIYNNVLIVLTFA